MRRHNRRLFRVTRSVLRDADAAQDAVQETYLRAFTQARQLPAHRQIRRVDHARGAQRSADDAPARARRHDFARRSRRRSAVSRKRRRPATRPPRINSWKRRMRARCSNTPSMRCRKTSAWFRAARGRRARRARNRRVPGHQCRHGPHAPVPRAAPAARSSCRAGCRARARRSSISARSVATASWPTCSRACRANYGGNAQPQ